MLPSAFPEPELFLPGSGEPSLRWGVIAPGRIANNFASAMGKHTAQTVVAVASRTKERAEAFAAEHGASRAYGSYDQLVADPEVDVVYIAAPASEHFALGMLAIAAGKHTLIEKPLATNAADARTLVSAARDAGVFLMEAMWTRYLPQSAVIRRLLSDGVLGEVVSVMADFGHAVPRDTNHRLYKPELAGGALLDLGIYPIQLDSMVFGAPTSITARGAMTDTGVDAYSTMILGHGATVQSTLSTSMLARTPGRAAITGTDARIEIAPPFHIPTGLTLASNAFDGPIMQWRDDTGLTVMDGLAWEATALAQFVGEGRTESPLHTLDETVSILETIDETRRQITASAADSGRAADHPTAPHA